MSLGSIKIGHLSINRFIIGGNPFTGFLHQNLEKDNEARHYYTVDRIKKTLREAESLGVNTFIGRTDNHIMRMLTEYWDEGGTIQWIAQTATGLESIDRGVNNAIKASAKACFIHGGQMDNLFAENKFEEVYNAVAKIRVTGMPAGIAGHNPKVFKWAEQNLDVDFYMVSYYHPSNRAKIAEYMNRPINKYASEDRDLKVKLIQTLTKPAIHFKVMAAGRNDPKEAFSFVAQHLRPQDAVCVGIYTKDNPEMIKEDIKLLEDNLNKFRNSSPPS